MEEASASAPASASCSTSGKVRLVRCPKCENLLPEMPDFSVYQCGGCGAVLRAKKKRTMEDGLPEISDVENGRTVSSKEVIAMGSGNVCETEVKHSGHETGKMKALHSNSSLGSIEAGRRDHEAISVHKRRDLCRGDNKVYDEEEHNISKSELDNQVFQDDGRCVGLGVPQCAGNEPKQPIPSAESFSSGPVIDSRGGERKKFKDSFGDARQAARQVRFMDCPYSDEGPSSKYRMGSYYGANDRRRYYDGLDGFAKVATLENDRAELLRKIDELKDQLSRTCDISEKPKERIVAEGRTAPAPIPTPSDSYSRHNMFMQGSFGANKHSLGRDHQVGFPYIYDDRVSGPYNGRHCSMMQDAYLPMHFSNGTLGYENAYMDEIIKMPPHQPYLSPSDLTSDLIRPYPPHESRFHHPACSCFNCFNHNMEPPPVIQQSTFRSRRSRNDPANPVMCHSSAHGYTSEGSSSSHPNAKWLTRSSSDLSRKNCTVGLQRHPRKLFVGHGSGKVCRTVAGGAPFISCYNCFELLKLPQKDRMVAKDQNKIRCGTCSSIIVFELNTKGIALSAPQIKQVQVNESINMPPHKRLHSSSGFISPCSDDYDEHHNFKYEFHDTFRESGKRQEVHSLSSSFSEHEKSPRVGNVRKDCSRSAELHIKDDVSPLLPDSPLHHDHLSSDDVTDICSRGTKIESADEKIIDGWTYRQNSVKDACVATEIDISMPQESTEVAKEDRQNGKRGSESFIVGILKRGFGELARSGQNSENRRLNVFVNGKLISGRVLKKAEKLAGPIQPGDYWYDHRAGFWGVMGHPCLGITMPNIEEFNYAMPKNCAAGNTGVIVNGRELHEKDMDLLVRRGLPLTRNKSYLIEMSGRVFDVQTGEELDGLGKLAPTVERAGHGFGMRVPKSLVEESH
ncbi:unnamed protein product [Cuscuta epithymum]|uniref:Zinc-ribbon domain-containing protein n=1 Tax=Cuscuta epithymum TaxID=186058 RepID=A0AAV0F9W1_9ASTE|nr:unnamed protein product [Cuscuta epithymum]